MYSNDSRARLRNPGWPVPSGRRVRGGRYISLVLSGIIFCTLPVAVGAGHPESDEERSAAEELEAIISGGIEQAEPGVFLGYDTAPRAESDEVALNSLEEVEIKVRMNAGDTILFSWEVVSPVYVDFHGEPFDYPDSPAVRYEERDGQASGHGKLTAPFDGYHGWYWLNVGDEAVTISLSVTGYFEEIVEVHRRQR